MSGINRTLDRQGQKQATCVRAAGEICRESVVASRGKEEIEHVAVMRPPSPPLPPHPHLKEQARARSTRPLVPCSLSLTSALGFQPA